MSTKRIPTSCVKLLDGTWGLKDGYGTIKVYPIRRLAVLAWQDWDIGILHELPTKLEL